MIMDKIIKFLDRNNIPFEENISLKKKTWIHRGGMCSLFITPTNSRELEQTAQFLYKEKMDFLLIGHTSNLYILNNCNIPVVVSTAKCNKFEISGNTIICEGGVGVPRLAKTMSQQGIAGFEHLHELPGTVGAAIYNNSSCHSNSIAQLLVSAEVVTSDGNITTLYAKDFNFKFRTSIMKEGTLKGVITKVYLKAECGNAEEFLKIATATKEKRKNNLEGNAMNLGCTVNRCFINGNMPLKYSIPLKLYGYWLKLRKNDILTIKKKCKEYICRISGYQGIAPYISDKNIIVFMWKDEGADKVFPLYLEFMRKVYKTDKVEIEIIG